MKLADIHSVYFVGIGGIGMSALARWFKHNGKAVSGYDKTETVLTKKLQEEGINVHFEDDLELIPSKVKNSTDGVLVVFTPAIPKDHNGLNWLKDQGYEVMKRSQVLGVIAKSMKTVAVAGTHGKTTTSSMVVHLLKTAGIDCTGFLGGIATNYETNMIMNESEDSIAVIEADEFDRSFMTLFPDYAIVTAADPDHLDIYGDKETLKNTFRDFIGQVKTDGQLIIKEELAEDLVRNNDLAKTTYGLTAQGVSIENLKIEDGTFIFDYVSQSGNIDGLQLLVPGYHNAENMMAAITVARMLGATDEAIRNGVSTYKGVKRRFEWIIKTPEFKFIDDYAHHPVEIKAFLSSVRDLFPGKKITAVFQPHLFTRTRDFAEGFSSSLSLADEVILLDIYPARELPIEGVDSQMILKDITIKNKSISSKEDLIENIKQAEPEVLLTIGAGDIDKLVSPIKEAML